jgi:glycosyltransferase involved in cell wall biosynthesis
MALAKSNMLPVGCDLRRLDAYQGLGTRNLVPSPSPLVLWNQRWEYDKDPATMLRALYALADEGLAFRVALAGENFRVQPAEFEEARARLGDRLAHYGFVESGADYARLLWDADIVLSTAIHEFFGVSIVEAIYCGCLPILPRRLSYTELIQAEWHDRCPYDGFDGLLARLRAAIADPTAPQALGGAAARFDWQTLAPVYDAFMVEQVNG